MLPRASDILFVELLGGIIQQPALFSKSGLVIGFGNDVD